MRGQDGVQGRPVLWVGLKHLLDQIVQLIGQVAGEGRVGAPTHLKDQALPAGRLELRTKTKGVKVGQQARQETDNIPKMKTQDSRHSAVQYLAMQLGGSRVASTFEWAKSWCTGRR